jgi:hypothetical protein
MIGPNETNPITDEIRKVRDSIQDTVDLTDSRLYKIVRLRLVTDPGYPFYDVSYCYGMLNDGTYVRVRLPRYQFDRKNLHGELIEMGKEHGVYMKGLGIFDSEVISLLA